MTSPILTTVAPNRYVDRPDTDPQPVRVQLVDHDPISRHVIERFLREAAGLQLVITSAEHADPRIRRHLACTDVVVICCDNESCCASPDRLAELVSAMSSYDVRMVLVASRWTRQLVDRAVSTGVYGCLVKSRRLDGLTAGIHAVSRGQCVLSPELLSLCLGSTASGTGQRRISAADGPPTHLQSDLTPREHEVLGLLSQGLTTQETAVSLHITPATVKSHVSHALTKLGARNRLEAVLQIRKQIDG